MKIRVLATLIALGAMSLVPLLTTGSAVAADDNVYLSDHDFPGASGELWKSTISALRGKKVTYVVNVTGFPLFDAWTQAIKRESELYGIDLTIQDGNWNTDAMNQAIVGAISGKADLLIIHNADRNVFSRNIKAAQEAGIYVVQLNMNSTVNTDAFVGGDYFGMGATIANDIVKDCSPKNGKSGKIAIVQGSTTASASFDQYVAAKQVFAEHPEIQIVSDQSTGPMWATDNAKQIVSAAIIQNPDLCAVYGMWDQMDLGSAAAIQESGKKDIMLYTSGGGASEMCDLVRQGSFTKYYAYNAVRQGYDIMSIVKTLLISRPEVGKSRIALFSPIEMLSKDTLKNWSCFDSTSVRIK
ncbi:sugar ABC transporter substrate-binding protein [Rhizobium sp. NZLR11]|uniref:sugar ABC transporter substrate-binding protein n=1 Tax=Rhizobium sp. NZLR11 TaxID=2731098 RepID=UPI001C837688|nr:sugar ABC transporter substrate-binding protein [Rhizobium sp. NZLR11]MBX5210472.1 sugar ABC transporter substrate-binding protein [Rhizobium sp. NZLR11]